MVEIFENFKSQRIPAFILMGVLPTAFIFHITGISIPEWVKNDETKAGLWEFCTLTCVKYSKKEDWLSSASAFAVISTLILIASLVSLIVISTTKLLEKNPSTIIMCSLCGSAGLLLFKNI